MAEPKITGAMRIVDGSTNLRTLKELNTLLTTLNNNLTTLMNFSTSEQIVGKWIDGKTLYRKVLTKTSNGSARDVSISTPSNIDTMVHMEVMGIKMENKHRFLIIPYHTLMVIYHVLRYFLIKMPHGIQIIYM